MKTKHIDSFYTRHFFLFYLAPFSNNKVIYLFKRIKNHCYHTSYSIIALYVSFKKRYLVLFVHKLAYKFKDFCNKILKFMLQQKIIMQNNPRTLLRLNTAFPRTS